MRKYSARDIALAAMVAAIYFVLCYFGNIFQLTFGPVQIRLGEALTVLPFLFPATAPGLALGCLLTNILSPYGPIDMIVGTLATAIAAFLMCLLATAGMLASTRAWIGGNMLLVSCLGFSAIPFSELIGVFFFKNIPDMLSLIGMTIVAAAGMIATVYTKKAEKAASSSEQKTR